MFFCIIISWICDLHLRLQIPNPMNRNKQPKIKKLNINISLIFFIKKFQICPIKFVKNDASICYTLKNESHYLIQTF
jgi:hypothetical protein